MLKASNNEVEKCKGEPKGNNSLSLFSSQFEEMLLPYLANIRENFKGPMRLAVQKDKRLWHLHFIEYIFIEQLLCCDMIQSWKNYKNFSSWCLYSSNIRYDQDSNNNNKRKKKQILYYPGDLWAVGVGGWSRVRSYIRKLWMVM